MTLSYKAKAVDDELSGTGFAFGQVNFANMWCSAKKGWGCKGWIISA